MELLLSSTEKDAVHDAILARIDHLSALRKAYWATGTLPACWTFEAVVSDLAALSNVLADLRGVE